MRRLIPLALALAVASPFGAAHAGADITVAPITLDFAPGARAFSTEISNEGDAAATVQIRLFAWRTDRDGDHYEPSQDIGFSPPIFRLEPGARQTLRLALLRPPPAGRESAYRLYVDQLPVAGLAGVQMPVRLVLPLFVPPAGPGRARARAGLRPALDWSATRASDGRITLVAANAGTRRAKLLELALHEPDGRVTPIRRGLAGYVLAGESQGWSFRPGLATDRLDISARDEEGEFRLTVPVSP